ncbi:hypothetical protein [Micromonospora pisi]|uniref:hypothetical protein n=1 Tax=Micromonospora pisi TaxID=589240 RepID=UPI001476BF6E|nr:hypothetical protein [Micromonospora pisi]
MTGVRHHLVDFLGILDGWGQRLGLGRRGAVLTEKVDRNFAISARWDLPATPG